jgi:hypothetical protein
MTFTACSAHSITISILGHTATHPVTAYSVKDADGAHVGYAASAHRSHEDRTIICQGPVTLTITEFPAVEALKAQIAATAFVR